MAFQTPITVKEAVDNVHAKKYLLPAIQREVVWDSYQIERLFDSLMRDYPIGSFLFWYVEKMNTRKYQFYEFVRDYHEKNNPHNTKADISGEDDITGILDGQQRLTSLYIGLRGSYAYKEPRKRWDNPLAFPKRRLYLNLLSPKKNDDKGDMYYDFSFLSDEEINQQDDGAFWFKVGDILDIKKIADVNKYLINNHLMQKPENQAEYANDTLFKLWSVVHDAKIINHYLEKDESLDKVLNIFIRVNSGGTILSYSDLLLSIATAQWTDRDARDVITNFVDDINKIGNGYSFNKDLVLKSCLVISDIKDITFKVDNFNRANMLQIEREWEAIAGSLRGAITLLSAFGYSRDTLTANNAIIPIAYYLKKKEIPRNFDVAAQFSEDRKAIHRWLILALVKRVFGGAPDSVLRPMREVIKGSLNEFPFEAINEKFKGTNKSLVITADDVENMLEYRHGQGYTFSTLALLYPTFDFRNRFHMDHIHPRSKFTRPKLRQRGISETDIDFYLESVDKLPNLQLLEGIPNQEKSDSDFNEWIDNHHPSQEERMEYVKRHFIPGTDLSLTNFRKFYEKRKEMLRTELLKTFNLGEGQ